MNKLAIVQAAGIGCGAECTCSAKLAASLSEQQARLLTHVIAKQAIATSADAMQKTAQLIEAGGIEQEEVEAMLGLQALEMVLGATGVDFGKSRRDRRPANVG